MGDFQVDVFEPLRKIDGLLVVVIRGKFCRTFP